MENKSKNNLELVAPAGNMEKLKAGLAHGADAVYVGIPAFSLRARANEFDIKKISEATEYCRARGRKIYATINIVAHNRHLKNLPEHIKKLKKIKVDGLIISDPGVLEIVRDVWPEAVIHLSTQANCVNWRAAKFWHKTGVKRIILGRETTLAEIKEIHKKCPEVELEYFVHGAMCMAYSGRCFLSKYFVGRSGNLGDCVQPCRWKYGVKSQKSKVESSPEQNFFIAEEKRLNQPLEIVEEENGSYILNSKDLCLLKYLKDLRYAGVTSFKIEGRAKSVYYQAMVSGIYSRVIRDIDKIKKKEIDNLYKELENKIMNRGYTEGFLLGEKADQEVEMSHQNIGWEFCGVVVGNNKNKIINIKVHNTLKSGDRIEIVTPFYGIINMKVNKLVDNKTNKEIGEAHGGAGKIVSIKLDKKHKLVPEFSVIRRKL
ncbi:MAG: U32 family peptidase C-terminal domain-containing protein [bacterium]